MKKTDNCAVKKLFLCRPIILPIVKNAVFLPFNIFIFSNDMLKKHLQSLLFLLLPLWMFAQNPVKWSFTTKDAGNCQMDLIITGTIDDGWYTYSQFLESDEGPVATSFTFKDGAHFKLVGKAQESGDKFTVHDKVFDMKLTKFKHKAVFTQRVEVSDPSKPIKGYVSFMSCNDEMCLPPKDIDFSFTVNCNKAGAPAKTDGNTPAPAPTPAPGAPKTAVNTPPPASGFELPTAAPTTKTPAAETTPITAATPENNTGTGTEIPVTPGYTQPDDEDFKGFFNTKRPEINSARFVNTCGVVQNRDMSGMGIFIGGFLGGLLALLTPCVFPMIPMTVSFFVKRSKNRQTGLRNAFLYGGSIILIYVALGAVVTAIFGPTVLNEMSTNKWFNLAFFAIFVIFALSFFGLFEITLPSSWVNKSDQMADKGGLAGIFFMAFTLALVSFSCTGPIVGTLLVEAARSNDGAALLGQIPVKPLIGMFGFGLALALPFALFAMFPGWLHSLPKSGSWMDNVKITLGIVELALALKFLSTADMTEHWGILKFETFLALWIVLAVVLGLYQLGILRWKGATARPGVGRIAVGLASLGFAAYMTNGLLRTESLSLLSGLAPPTFYSYHADAQKKAGGPHAECPLGINCYHDFDEAVIAAKEQGKPLLVDFTGYGCVNCRKMEENVWNKPGVLEHLRDNYIVVSLYVDDKQRLFPDNKFHYLLDPVTNEKIRTVGDKWSEFQVTNFNISSQPYYALMHYDGRTVLNEPRGYTPDVAAYKSFLNCGFEAFERIKNQSNERIGMQ
jgi:thiol:disulfide interchange protein